MKAIMSLALVKVVEGVQQASIVTIAGCRQPVPVHHAKLIHTRHRPAPKHARRVRQHAQPMRFSYAVGTMREPVNRVRVASILTPTSVNRVVVAPQANTESAARGQMLDCAKLVYLGRIKPLRGRRLVCPVTNVTSTN